MSERSERIIDRAAGALISEPGRGVYEGRGRAVGVSSIDGPRA
ncbi:hypothetical protein [Nocardia miyunensis]|nr:hypothetical protein [Nocardia miyunensis]